MKEKFKTHKVFRLPCNNYAYYIKKLRLGDDYMVRYMAKWRLCRLVKATRKGFNLLDLETSKCILRTHLYARGMAGKDIPNAQKHFSFNVPEYVTIGERIGIEGIG